MEQKVSSGLFGLPAGAQSVDWVVVNDSPAAQPFTVTVFKAGGTGPKTVVAPGPLTQTIQSGHSFHNANSVGSGQPFVPGFYYEVVVEREDHRVLPSVMIWGQSSAEIPGTLISPGTFVEI
jgi:hypothetical protein